MKIRRLTPQTKAYNNSSADWCTGSEHTNLSRLELWGFAVKHVHGFDAVLQHADRPVEHSHQVAEDKCTGGQQNHFSIVSRLHRTDLGLILQ